LELALIFDTAMLWKKGKELQKIIGKWLEENKD
jgi:hypothetical protein